MHSNDSKKPKGWHTHQLLQYDIQRNKDLKNCSHAHWSKWCTRCRRVVSSELTDEQYLDYLQLKKDYTKLETIIINYIYG